MTGWQIKRDLPGRLRLKNPVLVPQVGAVPGHRARARERPGNRSVQDQLDHGHGPGRLRPAPAQQAPGDRDPRLGLGRPPSIPKRLDKLDLHLPVCTASLPLAAAAQFALPPLLPVAAAVFAYTSIPTFKEAYKVLFKEKRLGVDVLDSIVVIGCLGTMSIFPGAVLCWCLSFGRVLVKRTQDNSKKLLLNAFGKQPRYVWLYRDGVEVQVTIDRLAKGDVIVVNTGEVVPVDGHVVEGMAMIDQHALTGESTPAEKGVGDRVFASTVMVAGKVYVSVETSGSETASAKISQILNDTAGYKLASQHQGERLADKAVIPTLSIGAVGLATMGPAGAVAVLNSDFGTGIRMAAPLAMLSSLALCANKGILVKDGRALELMNEVDTVLFDKTGTLTRERPEVGRVIAAHGFDAEQILGFAAAAERRFHHPIALAILHKAQELKLDLPPTDDTQYKVGYGITVHALGTCHPRRQQAIHGDGRDRAAPGGDRGPGAGASRRLHDGHGRSRRPPGRGDRAASGGPARGPRDHPGAAQAPDQAHRDHFGRPRGTDQEAGRIAGHGPVLRPGPARRQGRLRREASEGRLQGLFRGRRDQRFDRPQEGQRIDLAAGRIVDRDRHGPHRLPRRRAGQAVRAPRHRPRPRSQREAKLVDDPGTEHRLHRRRVHLGVRDHGVGRDQQRRRPGGTGQRHAPLAQGRPDRGRT